MLLFVVADKFTRYIVLLCHCNTLTEANGIITQPLARWAQQILMETYYNRKKTRCSRTNVNVSLRFCWNVSHQV